MLCIRSIVLLSLMYSFENLLNKGICKLKVIHKMFRIFRCLICMYVYVMMNFGLFVLDASTIEEDV